MPTDKLNTISEMEHLKHDMDEIWNEIFSTPKSAVMGSPWRQDSGDEGVSVPAIDVIDCDETVLVRIEMPGVGKDDLELTVDDNILNVKGTITRSEGFTSEDFYHSERTYKSFVRAIELPVKIDHKKVTASLEDGILDIHLPKIATDKMRKIKIEVD